MDSQSIQTIEILNAEAEYNDMYDVEEENIETGEEASTERQEPHLSETQATQHVQGGRKRRKTSTVWSEFSSVGFESNGKERAECCHCGHKLVINSRTHGTNTLRRHLLICPKKPKKEERPPYDHKVDRSMTTEIIIYHDMPFRYVEYEKVRERDKYLNPDCVPICRQTPALDVFRRYEIEKEKLKDVLKKHRSKVCFTSDLWLARTSMMSYICLTAHFIDDSWRLNSKILAFSEMKSPHTGEEIATRILDCLKEWGLEKKVFTMTLDNATNNGSMVRILKGQLQMVNGSDLLRDGKFMHVRCCAHILNLIVKEGLLLATDVLNNIRESVKYVKSSSQRKEAFATCVKRVGIKSAAGLSLDVPTRWNSTYQML